MNYAGFGWRFLSYLIDTLIFVIAMTIINRLLLFPLMMPVVVNDPHTLNPAGYAPLLTGMNLIWLLVSWAYFAGFESSSWQATPGKRALGVYVTDLNGNRLTLGRATGRFFGKILSAMILCIGYIMIAFTERKQGLHDIIAKTLVMKKAA